MRGNSGLFSKVWKCGRGVSASLKRQGYLFRFKVPMIGNHQAESLFTNASGGETRFWFS